MGLVINTNIAAINAARNLDRSTRDLKQVLQRMSSGLRINSAKDDAAGLAIAEGFRAQGRGLAVAQRNAQDGVNMLQTMEGALGESASILQRMRELAVQSANGTLGVDTTLNQNRVALDNEVAQLKSQLDTIANDTEFSGTKLLNGVVTVVTLQVGYKNAQILTVGNVDARASALFTGSISTQALAAAALTLLDGAINSVSSMRGTFGAQMNRLEFTINTLAIQEENASASESAIRDADIASETSRFTRSQVLVSAGTSILAQSNVIPQSALQLLG